MADNGLSICTAAAIELGAVAAGEPLSAADAAWILAKANRLLNNWNAEREAVYNSTLVPFTIVPSLNPSTIGPTGATFTVTQRPVSIDGAVVVLTNVTPNVSQEITIRDEDWWRAQSVKAITSTFPTDLFYSPSWPNGDIYLWPVPTVAYELQLQLRTVLASFTLTGAVSLPPGYLDAFILTLAEEIGPGFGLAASPQTVASAAKARARVFANNHEPQRIMTQDAGMPSASRPDFNYKTGLFF
jgi:hypothetical protein